MSSKAIYRPELDLLKGFAIIAVVFYHTGWLATGYLGVDVFFAINGFLVIPSLLKQVGQDSWRLFSLSTEGGGYAQFLLRRILRLWPLILIAAAICLIIGFFGMLPDDYENLAQSVIASDLMSQNILSAITTKNYWDAVNEYKPLMHFWYVGILVEFYIVMPLILTATRWVCRKSKVRFNIGAQIVLWGLFFASLFLYFLPSTTTAERFYFLPCRLFELISGGLVGIYFWKETFMTPLRSVLGKVGVVLIVFLLLGAWYLPSEMSSISPVSGVATTTLLIPQDLLLVLAVAFTCCVLAARSWSVAFSSAVIFLGKMSFSVFVWHQILLAFYRYFVSDEMSLVFGIGLWCVTLSLSFVSFYCVEQKIKVSWKAFGLCVCLMTATIIPAGWVYLNAGVVRDVPELNIRRGDGQRGMFSKYCDRVYAYNENFPKDSPKLNVLVEGVSFGRDFANVLLESEWADKINLSYIFRHNEKYADRYAQCDYLFTFSKKTDIPACVWKYLNPKAKVFGLGTKNFGTSNGIVYQCRGADSYINQSIEINPNFYLVNEDWKSSWGEGAYIDFLRLSSTADGKIRVFTDEGKFISADCRHLGRDGARWFAKKINWKKIFEETE